MTREELLQAHAYRLGHRRACQGWLELEAGHLWHWDQKRHDMQDAIAVLGETETRKHYEQGLRDGGLPEHA